MLAEPYVLDPGKPGIGAHLVDLPMQTVHYLLDRHIALGQRLQDREQCAVIRPPYRAADRLDRRVLMDNFDKLAQLLLHQLKRAALVGPDATPNQPVVLQRNKSLGNNHKKPNGGT